MEKAKQFLSENLHWWVVLGVAILCGIFIFCGKTAEDGSITLDGSKAVISESTKQFIEDSQAALYRLMNEDKPTDEATEEANNVDEAGLGFSTSIDQILARRLPDGDTDGGRGWQCSKYTGYLATGKREYSSTHLDYGPRNGKDMAQYLVDNYGFKYIDQPVAGAIGSGGWNTLYGHTVLYLYSTGDNTAMVNEANYVPLTVGTRNMSISGWVWVVPGDYEPEPEPEPTPNPSPVSISCDKRTLIWGETLSEIMKLCEGKVEWGEAMTSYAQSWVDEATGKTVWEGWNSGSGVGLFSGHTIVRK